MKIKNLKSEVIIKYYVISLSDKAWISNTSYVGLTKEFKDAKKFPTYESAKYYYDKNSIARYFKIISVR